MARPSVPLAPHDMNKPSLKQKVSTWFRNIGKQKCTCTRTKPTKPKKEKKNHFVSEPIQLPRKYINETKLYSFVGGKRVPYIPSQVSHLKETRKSYDPIEESHELCVYCRSMKATTPSIFDDDDDEDY